MDVTPLATESGRFLITQGVLGVAVLALCVAVVFLFLRLQASQKDVRDMTKELATLAAETLSANREVANALDRMTATGDGRTRALEEMTKEVDRLGHDMRHGLAQPMQVLTSVLEQTRDLASQVRDVVRNMPIGGRGA